jgi:pimeloyl-ACP methyl ester carboxylesterase
VVVDRLEAGRPEEGAAEFVDTIALGPGAWAQLSPAERAALVANAPTFLDERRDPEALVLPLSSLASFPHRALLSDGEQSFPLFPLVLEQLAAVLPHVERQTFPGAGHIPHVTHPEEYAATLMAFAGET